MHIFELGKTGTFAVADVDSNSLLTLSGEATQVDASSMMYVLQGSCSLSIGRNDYSFEQNAMVLVFTGEFVKVESVSADFRAKILLVNGPSMQEIVSLVPNYMLHVVRTDRNIRLENNELLRRFILNIYDNIDILLRLNTVRIYEEMKCQIVSLFGIIIDNTANQPSEPPEEQRLSRLEDHFKRFISLLVEHHKQERDVAYYADRMHISPKYLNYICNNVAHTRCKAIIDGFVIMQLKNALKMTQRTIQEIAYDYNFPNQSFFGTYFKRYAGVSPTAYRSGE